MGAACSDEGASSGEPEVGPGAGPEVGLAESEDRTETWRNELLDGVDEVEVGRFPGRLLVFGGSAEPVVTYSQATNTLVAAASLGLGRLVALSWEGLTDDFLHSDRKRNLRLRRNVIAWTTRSPGDSEDVRVVGIDKMLEFSEVLQSVGSGPVVLVWKGKSSKSGRFVEELEAWVRRGGALVCGLTPWAQASKGTNLEDIPLYPLLKAAGILLTGAAVRPPVTSSRVLMAENMAPRSHVQLLVNTCLESREGLRESGEDLAHVVSLLREDGSRLLKDDLKRVIERHRAEVHFVPTRVEPVASPEGKALTFLFSHLLFNGWTESAIGPGCENFPGVIPAEDIRPATRTVKLVSGAFVDLHLTGLYLPPGQEITLKVLQEKAPAKAKWKVLIGAHTDKMSISFEKPLRRWPKLSETIVLTEDHVKFRHPFGGLVMFLSPGVEGSELHVDLHNVVQTPVCDLRKENHLQVWKYTRDAPGLWAELSGRHISFVYPRDTVRGVDDPTPILQYWDTAVKHIYDLRGRSLQQTRRQVIVFDEQPSLGLMHSGYPIVGQLKLALLKDGQLPQFLNLEHMAQEAPWGVLHEVGHNMQNSSWTFEGTKEVTCNIFAMYATEKALGESAWTMVLDWPENKLKQVRKHLETSPTTYASWKRSPWTGLVMYMQLARDFGWKAFAEVFRRYESLRREDLPSTNQARIDLWMTTFSNVVAHNLTPLFCFWGLPLSEDAQNVVASLSAYFPADIMTEEFGAAQTTAVLEQYPDAVRIPRPGVGAQAFSPREGLVTESVHSEL